MLDYALFFAVLPHEKRADYERRRKAWEISFDATMAVDPVLYPRTHYWLQQWMIEHDQGRKAWG